MKKTIIVALLIVAVLGIVVWWFTGDVKLPDSYNYQRGVEACKAGNIEEAISYLNKEIEGNNHNGYAFFYLGMIHEDRDEKGEALDAYNKAVKYIGEIMRPCILFMCLEALLDLI